MCCCRLLGKVQEWLARADALTQTRAPLKRMREVAHAGMRLPVDLPQAEDLRGDIRWREWQDATAKVLSRRHACPPAYQRVH